MKGKIFLSIVASLTAAIFISVFFNSPTPERSVSVPPDAPVSRKSDTGPFSVDYVTDNAGKYHRKVIKVEGKISSAVRTKRHKEKDYTIFKMKNSKKGGTMLVYLKGSYKNLEKNDRLRIRGRFYKSRKYLFIKLKNVLKGKTFELTSQGAMDSNTETTRSGDRSLSI